MLEPLYSKLIIKPKDEVEATASGLLIPSLKGKKQQVAEVIAAGQGHILNDGVIRPLYIKAGDTIIYEKFAGTNIVYEDNEYLIIDESDVLAKVN